MILSSLVPPFLGDQYPPPRFSHCTYDVFTLLKVAWNRESAKRFFRLSTTGRDSPPHSSGHFRAASSLTTGSSSYAPLRRHGSVPPQNNAEVIGTDQATESGPMSSRSSPYQTQIDSSSGMIDPCLDTTLGMPTSRNEKVVASGSGITVSIGLTEPVLFLEGYERNDRETRKTAMLRGRLRLNITKSLKVKKVYLNFRGFAITTWPEGEFRCYTSNDSLRHSNCVVSQGFRVRGTSITRLMAS